MYFNEKRQELAPFVNLRSDVGFKAVFADRNNKDILIGVLEPDPASPRRGSRTSRNIPTGSSNRM